MGKLKEMRWWGCLKTWRKASVNTLWCVAGCSIGEFGTLASFQHMQVDPMSSFTFMILPVVNGILTSVALETAILARQMPIFKATESALKMSFVSMIAMEASMEMMDYALTGSMTLQMWAVPPMLLAGFVVPLPYNYWRLKKHGRSCH